MNIFQAEIQISKKKSDCCRQNDAYILIPQGSEYIMLNGKGIMVVDGIKVAGSEQQQKGVWCWWTGIQTTSHGLKGPGDPESHSLGSVSPETP